MQLSENQGIIFLQKQVLHEEEPFVVHLVYNM